MTVNIKISNSKFRLEFWEKFWSDMIDISDTFNYNSLLRKDYKNKKIIELGCGDLSQSSEIISQSKSYVGVDISQNALKRATSSWNFSSKTKLICSDIVDIPIKYGTAESIISIDTMSALGHDFNYGLKKIFRLLIKNGVLNFNITHTDWFLSCFDPDNKNSSMMVIPNGVIFKFGQKEVFTSTPDNICIGLYQTNLKPLKINIIHSFQDAFIPITAPMTINIRAIKI